MAKKLLSIVLALTFVFAFGMVTSAEASPNCEYVCECVLAQGEECEHECTIECSPCHCGPDAPCVEGCDCATGGPCICPRPTSGGRNIWHIVLGVIAGILVVVGAFFLTRGVLTCVFC